MIPDISFQNIKTELEYLNNYNATPNSGVTRIVFSQEDLGARQYIKQLMKEVGLEVSEDAIGNIFGVLKGEDSSLKPIWSGSHIDTVINGGMYDGMTGVIGAIEACRWIKENNIPHKRDLTAVVYTSEEPTRYGVGCIGSHALTGHLTLDETKNMKDDNGKSLYSLLEELGYPLGKFDNIKKQTGDIFAHVEMHIEQAKKLDNAGISIGVVEGICAPSYIEVCINGRQEHAGSTEMKIRKDALCAAAEIILEVEKTARLFNTYCSDETTVGTVGKVKIYPNAPNVIAGKTVFIIDIRDVSESNKNKFADIIFSKIDEISKKRDVSVNYRLTENDIPRKSSKTITDIIENSCKSMDIDYMKMTSGAYHDSLLIAEIAPMAMIFVPSKDGISHDPKEFTRYEDIVLGTKVLTKTLIELANREEPLT